MADYHRGQKWATGRAALVNSILYSVFIVKAEGAGGPGASLSFRTDYLRPRPAAALMSSLTERVHNDRQDSKMQTIRRMDCRSFTNSTRYQIIDANYRAALLLCVPSSRSALIAAY